MNANKTNIFINRIVADLDEENVAIFAGAGLSMGAGYVGWSELLKPIAEELGLQIEKEHDLVALSQYYLNRSRSGRSELNRRLIEEFSEQSTTTENHRILSRLPIKTYWTTNYDTLLEDALKEQGRKPDVKYTKKHLTLTIPRRSAIVYKMHGDISHPDNAILTKDDYESYHIKMDLYLSALQGDLLTKTFIFLGFSFTDPNLDYILSRVRLAGRSTKRHYTILKNIKKNPNETLADFEYRQRKQELFIGDLDRFNIQAILVDEYSEITDILNRIENKYKRKNIFISGAAHEYGSWGRDKAENFLSDLSSQLIQKKLKVVSGFGLGIGSAVISGALRQIYTDPNKYSKDDLILRPFPQNLQGKEYWTQNRKDIVDYSGVAIFVFGNKVDSEGNIIHANGMREEFDIAKEKNLLLVPVGATGYISKQFWKELKELYEGCELFAQLGDDSLETSELLNVIIKFIEKHS